MRTPARSGSVNRPLPTGRPAPRKGNERSLIRAGHAGVSRDLRPFAEPRVSDRWFFRQMLGVSVTVAGGRPRTWLLLIENAFNYAAACKYPHISEQKFNSNVHVRLLSLDFTLS
jgi:hypothetical protein